MEKKPESIFINRELSWLDFDSRVLALAKEKTVPLGERIKFAAIFGSNMDEFFMVRVGSLYDQTLLKNNKTDNVTHMTAAEQIAAITPRVAELQAKCDKYFQHLVSALAQEGYKKVDFAKLAKPQEHFWKTYFQRELLPLQTILKETLASLQSSRELLMSMVSDSADSDAELLNRAQIAKYCIIVVSTVPAVVLYLCMQKFFVKGVMIGSVKG